MPMPICSERAFARTYGSDAWTRIKQYRQATTLRESNPEMARAEIARRVDRPASAVRGWLAEGKTPTPVRGLEIATEREWIDIDPSTETFRVLNNLVAWIFAGGSISVETSSPHFSADDPLSVATLDHLLTVEDVEYQIRDVEDGADEVIPGDDGAILGRVLTALGAPTGAKADQSDLTLPSYLSRVTTARRRDFIAVYVFNRCLRQDETIYLSEARPEQYTRELYTFLTDLNIGEVTYGSQNRLWPSSAFLRTVAGGEPRRPTAATRIAYGTLSPPTTRALAGSYEPDKLQRWRAYRAATESDATRKTLAEYHGVPRSTIRRWQAETTPAIATLVQIVRNKGWLRAKADDRTDRILTALGAWVTARGTLRASFAPVFRITGPGERAVLTSLIEAAGLTYNLRLETDHRPTELHISTGGTALGRTLLTRGVHPRPIVSSLVHVMPLLVRSEAAACVWLAIWSLHYGSVRDGQLCLTPGWGADEYATDRLAWLLTDGLGWSVSYPSDEMLVLDEPDVGRQLRDALPVSADLLQETPLSEV
jgi:transposase-like protein